MKKFLLLTLLSFTMVACSSRSTHPSSESLTPEQLQKNLADAGAVRAEHDILKKLAGNWKAESKFWTNPEGTPEVSKGTASSKLLYGGRYLAQNYKGNFMGQKFEGQGLMGYDNLTGKYFSTWIDSMSTTFMKSEGTAAAGDKIVLASAMTCPMTHEHMTGEDVVTVIDNDHYRYEGFQIKDGKKIKGMEILFSRIK